MRHVPSHDGLNCPYCGELLSSNRALRVHVGSMHRDKTDEFMEKYFGGRWIEVDFITLMLQRAIVDLTEEFCEKCGKCTAGCPISHVVPDFKPLQTVSQVRSGQVRELLKSDIIWKCASCRMCGEQCPADMSPYEINETLKQLSARISYHFPRSYKDFDKNILRSGIIQEPQVALARTGELYERKDLDLPGLMVPDDMDKFGEALAKLSDMRVVL